MRAGHIKVFDGLRMTTDHINHLQGSIHSAIQDIREILGLGKIHAGFEVVKESDQAVSVQPGIAFDFQKNRIVCDESQTVEVTFVAEEETKFVCAKYEQIEDGVVEGQPTLIWDSCSILLRNTPSTSEENLVNLAALVWNQEQETLEVVDLDTLDEVMEPEEPESMVVAEMQPEEPNPESMSEEILAKQEEQEFTGNVMTQPLGETEDTQSTSMSAMPIPESQVCQWHVNQGVVRISEDTEGTSLDRLILEPLRHQFNAGSNNGNESHLQFTLAEESVALDFYPISLSSQTILKARVWIMEESSNPESLSFQQSFQSTSRGEATFAGDTISQFSITTNQPWHSTLSNDLQGMTTEINETGIGYLSLNDHIETIEIPEDVSDVLQHLQFLVKVERSNDQGFKTVFKLIWKGSVHEEIIQTIENQPIYFTWESIIAWKVSGESQIANPRTEVKER